MLKDVRLRTFDEKAAEEISMVSVLIAHTALPISKRPVPEMVQVPATTASEGNGQPQKNRGRGTIAGGSEAGQRRTSRNQALHIRRAITIGSKLIGGAT